MAAPSPASEPDSERKYKLTLRRIDAVVTITKVAIKYASLVACVYLAYRALVALAGKQTLASVLLQVITDLKFHDGIYLILAAGGVIYGLGERHLRRRNIKRLSGGKIDQEKKLDPNRSSSDLTPRGTTRPEDKT